MFNGSVASDTSFVPIDYRAAVNKPSKLPRNQSCDKDDDSGAERLHPLFWCLGGEGGKGEDRKSYQNDPQAAARLSEFVFFNSIGHASVAEKFPVIITLLIHALKLLILLLNTPTTLEAEVNQALWATVCPRIHGNAAGRAFLRFTHSPIHFLWVVFTHGNLSHSNFGY